MVHATDFSAFWCDFVSQLMREELGPSRLKLSSCVLDCGLCDCIR